jgi:putative transposase
MPWGLKRFHASGQTHFVTFCCYDRRPLFTTPSPGKFSRPRWSVFAAISSFASTAMSSCPSTFPCCSASRGKHTLADALKSLKQGVSRRLIAQAEHFWQKRYYDFNVRNERQCGEKLRYIHRNPVKRGLCMPAEDWEWSSYRQYATGCAGTVEVECEWAARKRKRAAGRLCPAVELPHSSQKTA